MSKYKVVFMGTPTFAREILETLCSFQDLSIEMVVTQPDRKVGRKQIIQYSPVKQLALDKGLFVAQPERINDLFIELSSLDLDAIITCAYGQYIPTRILNLPKLGVINVHASVLPQLRGAAPMQYALMSGQTQTGISLMRSSKEMDAGDVFSQIIIDISNHDTLETLESKLIQATKDILQRDLYKILNETILAQPQSMSNISYAPTIKREDEKLDFTKSSHHIYNHIRALNPSPLVFTKIDNKLVKFKTASFDIQDHRQKPGKVISFDKQGLKITTIDGYVIVQQLQIEGKSLSFAHEIYNGYQHWIGLYCHE